MTFELKPEPSKMLVAFDDSNLSMNAANHAITLAKIIIIMTQRLFCHSF